MQGLDHSPAKNPRLQPGCYLSHVVTAAEQGKANRGLGIELEQLTQAGEEQLPAQARPYDYGDRAVFEVEERYPIVQGEEVSAFARRKSIDHT
jgi:hypothetical protein